MCPQENGMVKAEFKVSFERIGNGSSDLSIDLCRWHYDNLNIWKEKLS